jgi:hypothetical protein
VCYFLKIKVKKFKNRTQTRKPSQVSKYIFKSEIKSLRFVLVLFQIALSHEVYLSTFSKENPHTICNPENLPRVIGPHVTGFSVRTLAFMIPPGPQGLIASLPQKHIYLGLEMRKPRKMSVRRDGMEDRLSIGLPRVPIALARTVLHHGGYHFILSGHVVCLSARQPNTCHGYL